MKLPLGAFMLRSLSRCSDLISVAGFLLTLSWLVGIAPAAAQPIIIDDGDAGYSTTAGWTMFSGSGAFGDFDYTPADSGAETATSDQNGLE